ncbi:MAG: phosphate acyltransferase PlsX [Bacteroidetes bacterium]|nr:phosphate acyltransferase PlsX [Bacteroidota bacterium]
MRIGIDAMGGDFAPLEAVKGAIEAKKQMQDLVPVLFGQKDKIVDCFKSLGLPENVLEIVNADEVIEMGEHATKAIAHKKNSSINVAYRYLAEKQIEAFIGAGNTGAMLVGSIFSVKAIDGVLRPTIASVLPKVSGGFGVLLDVGANADCKPEVLNQFAILGALYAQHVYGIDNPKVALLSIGEEKEKGNLLIQAAYPLLEINDRINFVGNVEGRDLFNDKADVIVCDGYTGNIILKLCEGFYYNLAKLGVKNDYLDRFNFKQYGGTAILGVNEPVIIGHGISKSETFVSMFKLAKDVVSSQLIDKIKQSF